MLIDLLCFIGMGCYELWAQAYHSALYTRIDMKKIIMAEFFGTFWLVFASVGSALYAAAFPELGIGFLGVSLAFGLSVMTMAYAVGGISGGHFNPAVSLGLMIAGKFESKNLAPYIIAQVAGGVVAALMLYLILSGKADSNGGGAFASNGFGEHSPGGFGMISVLLMEIIMTGMFLIIILGATSKSAPAGFAPIAIGLGLTLIHLATIPVSNASVNPARSTASAVIAMINGEGWAMAQLWMFWLAPLVGGTLGAFIWKTFWNDAE
jgi:aquaporin Z